MNKLAAFTARAIDRAIFEIGEAFLLVLLVIERVLLRSITFAWDGSLTLIEAVVSRTAMGRRQEARRIERQRMAVRRWSGNRAYLTDPR